MVIDEGKKDFPSHAPKVPWITWNFDLSPLLCDQFSVVIPKIFPSLDCYFGFREAARQYHLPRQDYLIEHERAYRNFISALSFFSAGTARIIYGTWGLIGITSSAAHSSFDQKRRSSSTTHLSLYRSISKGVEGEIFIRDRKYFTRLVIIFTRWFLPLKALWATKKLFQQ